MKNYPPYWQKHAYSINTVCNRVRDIYMEIIKIQKYGNRQQSYGNSKPTEADVLADLNPRFGTEPGKLRPVLVVQTNLLNEVQHPSTLICPLTTQITTQSKWLRVHLKKGDSGLPQSSDILTDQIRAIDNRRFKKKLGELKRLQRQRVREAIKVMFDL